MEDHNLSPSAASLDSQTVPTAVGYDGGKKIKGRQRFTFVDTVGLRPQGSQGFVLLPQRWTVERTEGGWHWCRQLHLDDERCPAAAEACIHLAMIRLMRR